MEREEPTGLPDELPDEMEPTPLGVDEELEDAPPGPERMPGIPSEGEPPSSG